MKKSNKPTKTVSSLATMRKVLKYLDHYRILFALSLLLCAASVAMTLYLPVLTGEAIDLIVAPGKVDFDALTPLLLRGVIIIGITALCQWLMAICNNRMTFGVVRRLRQDAFESIQKLPLSFLDKHPVGGLVSRVISDADQFTDGLLMGFSQLFTGVLTIAGTLGFMLSLNLWLTLWVVIITPLSLFVASFIAKNTHHMFKKQTETRGEQTALIDEMLGSHKTVVAFSHEDEALAEFDEINGRLETVSRKATFFSSLTNPCTRFVNNLVYAGVALIGALMSLASGGVTLSIGQLSCFLTYANQYTKPFNEISGVITELQLSMTCAARLFELIEAEPEPAEPHDAVVLPAEAVSGEVELSDVHFSYDPEKELIRDLNLKLDKGQRVAIVGPTGCGKTTVINLLMRFYDVNEGSISVSGTDIRKLTRHSLRNAYGMVLQDTWLSAGTVKENISFGRPEATEDEIIAAAKAAHADSFIRRLPDGYNTVLGENGGTLSQGQKQLLCIARVFLCLPPMLILDEATSSIDTRTELKIQNAFATLMKGRTSFIVAHRLSTIKEADVILVMKDGRIIEQGDHKTLLKNGGFYAEMYHSQFEQ
ncbi:MAG: ABC transporter ATP-binding protein [Ruminococcaceae bacterium]|nr:ABC transporter ATP-binding protein [Oscillospiraceae bacterium]